MPRYFFHRSDRSGRNDHEGTELPDLAAAEREALRFVGSSLFEAPNLCSSDEPLYVEVTDADGKLVFSVLVTVNRANEADKRINGRRLDS